MEQYQSDMELDSQNEFCSHQSESPPQILMGSQIQELYKAKQRLKDFIKTLGDLRGTSIQKPILEYYSKVNERALTPENVIRMNERRVEKMLKNKKIKKNWSNEDVNILIWVLSKYIEKFHVQKMDDMQHKDWKFVADLIPGSSADRCMFKWLSLKKFNLANFKWEENESTILSQLVNDFGIKDWKYISQRLYKLNPNKDKIYRNAKQCRQHWSCYLNPKLKKGPWQITQDRKLLQCILKNNGLKKWSQIARKFHGRTQNALKNRFNLIMEKLKKTYKIKDEVNLIREEVQRIGNIYNHRNLRDQMLDGDYQQSRDISQESSKKQKGENCEQIYDDQGHHNDEKENKFFISHCSTKHGQSAALNSETPKIVKANYHQLLSLLSGSQNNQVQLVPAVMTNNNQFHINTVYNMPFGQPFMQ